MHNSHEKDSEKEKYCTKCGHMKNPDAKNGGGCNHDHARHASVGKNFCPHCGKKIR